MSTSSQNLSQIMSEESASTESTQRIVRRQIDTSPRQNFKLQLLKWTTVWCVLIIRLVGILLFIIWACDCFFREFRTTTVCRHFTLFPHPQHLITIWLMITVVSSIILMLYASQLSWFPRIGRIFTHLLKSKYFYKISFMLALVTTYNILTLLNHPHLMKTLQYIGFLLEDTSSFLLMLTLNFLPKFADKTDGEYLLKYVAYKVALVLYSLECFCIYISGTAIAVYHILTISTCTGEAHLQNQTISVELVQSFWESKTKEYTSCILHDSETVIMLLLLMNSNAYRYTIADFFLSKIFTEKSDILGGESRVLRKAKPPVAK